MQPSITLKQKDILNTLNNVGENHNSNSSEELIERKNIEGTPFTIVKTEGKCFLTMGKYQLTGYMEEEEIAIYIMENEWNIITTIAGIIAEHVVRANNKP